MSHNEDKAPGVMRGIGSRWRIKVLLKDSIQKHANS